MIIDLDRRPPADLPDSDVCIVGGGPAGISIAMRLAGAGLSVLLVESGGRKETAFARDLNRGSAFPAGSHEPLEENRRRQWGGASAVWGGRCIPFDDVDFAARDWVPRSGWPFPHSDVEPYYRAASQLCEAGQADFDARTAVPAGPELLPGLDGDGIVTHRLERWSRPTHFGRRYRRALQASPNVSVVINATCTGIQLADTGDRVEAIRVGGRDGAQLRARSRSFVLAAGGLENARILLASTDVIPDGIGNHSGCLGRFYQTHLFGSHARLVIDEPTARAHVAFDRDDAGVYCRRRISITAARQESDRLLNTVFFPVRPPSGASGHRSAMFSAVYLAKTAAAALRRPRSARSLVRSERDAIIGHLKVFLRDLPSALPEIARTAAGRYLGTRRLPAVLPPDGLEAYHLQFQAEQIPNPDARVALGPDRDPFGVPRLVVAPRATAQDVESVVVAHRVLDRRLRATGLGHLEYDEAQLRSAVLESTRRVNSAAHHLGTTRMAVDPADGVVDANCRVHGIDNLFVAGGSVLPTSGHANPTLIIVALALRLADHLANRLRD